VLAISGRGRADLAPQFLLTWSPTSCPGPNRSSIPSLSIPPGSTRRPGARLLISSIGRNGGSDAQALACCLGPMPTQRWHLLES